MTSLPVRKKVDFQHIGVVQLLKLYSDNTRFHALKTEKEPNSYSKLLLAKCHPTILNLQING